MDVAADLIYSRLEEPSGFGGVPTQIIETSLSATEA